LPSFGVAVGGRRAETFLAALRRGNPSVVGRIEAGRGILDLRTVEPERDDDLVSAVRAPIGWAVTVAAGAAGHLDHRTATLLRALTGIDADRLPEEQRRGMTIDVGYAHMALDDGTEIDFVDVPGHDRLVGNMLVGAGEIDAAMLVVAADDGPRAQTLEHLELLDALGIDVGLAVVTKADAAGADRAAEVAEASEALLARTTLRGSPVVVASGASGEGLDLVRAALTGLRDIVLARDGRAGGPRLAVDRSFSVRGRGTVVTGSLRGGPLDL